MAFTENGINLAQAPYLPPEIVQMIVRLRRIRARLVKGQWRNDIQSLSFVRSDFVDTCQAALFEYVVIQPPSWTVNGLTYHGPDLTRRFSELIAERPQLGKYVLSLLYRLPRISRPLRDATEAATALEHLTQVHYLHIEHEESREGDNDALDWAHFTSTKWRKGRKPGYPKLYEAFRALIGNDSLRTLILKNIRIPAEVICKARGLEVLQLDGSDCHEPIEDGPHNPLLIKKLYLTGSAAYDIGWDLSPGSRHPVTFTTIDTLHTSFGGNQYEEHAKKVILGHATQIRTLELYTSEDHPFGALRAANAYQHLNPLRHLSSDAFCTLTSLSVDIVFALSDPPGVISDPWQGLCSDSTLRKLKALQYLTIKVWIGGPGWRFIDIDANFLNSRWRRLERVLVPKNSDFTLDRLKVMELIVGIHGNCRSAPKAEVDAFLPRIQKRALSLPWMLRLLERSKKSDLSVVTRMARRHHGCRVAQCQG